MAGYEQGKLDSDEALLVSWQRELFGSSQVYLLEADGLHQITQNTGFDYHVGYWATDPGTCFVTTQYGNVGHLYLYGVDGSRIRELSPDGRVKNVPLLSPDGRYLAYWAHPVENGGGMTLLDWQNHAQTILTSIQRPVEKCWAMDSQSLVIIMLDDDEMPVWIRVGLDGQELEREPLPQFNERYDLTLSTDWQRMAYTRLDEAMDSHLMVSKRDGSEARHLGLLNAMESPPAWSPDSQSIAWVADDGTGRHQLFVADAVGANIRLLMILDDADESNEIYPGHPAWSSDSRRIAITSFVRNPNGRLEDGTDAGAAIFVVDAASGAVRQMSDASGIIFSIQWRPVY